MDPAALSVPQSPEKPPPTPPSVYDLFGCVAGESSSGGSSSSDSTSSSTSADSLALPRLVKESLAAPTLDAAKEDEPRQERALTSGPTLATSTSGLSELLQQQLQIAQVSDAAPLPPPSAAAPELPGGYELFPMAPPTERPVQEVVANEFALFPSMSGSNRSLDVAGVVNDALQPADLPPPPPSTAVTAMTTTTAAALTPPSYKMSGNAVDIIAVRNMDDQYLTTSWHVRDVKACALMMSLLYQG